MSAGAQAGAAAGPAGTAAGQAAASPGTAGASRAGGISLRRAAPHDRAGVEHFLLAAGLPIAGVDASLAGFVVAEQGSELVGVAGLETHGGDGVLRSVAVAPSHRGTGLGARLTAHVIEQARAAGVRRLYLLTTTAAAYFPRHGFRRVARDAVSPPVQASVEFAEACPASAVAMVLDLT